MSCAKLTWVFKESRRARAERELRSLMIAAGGAQGGKAFEMMAGQLEREQNQLGLAFAEAKTESQMPLNGEQFAEWMNDGQQPKH